MANQFVSRKWKWIGIGISMLVLGIGSSLFLFKGQMSMKSENRLAPPFTLPTQSGKSMSLSSFDDSLVILHFWATWCPPCIGEIPELMDYAKRNRDRKVKILAISLDDSWEEAMKIFPKPSSIPENFILLLDSKAKVAEQYGSYNYPETYLVNRKREIIGKWIGPQEWSHSFFSKILETEL